jgi:hypothetical protein
MQTLIANKENISEIKRKVEEKDGSLYNHIIISNIIIDNNTISIIMTSCNRSKQTYFTLQTIKNSSHKEIQVIIVDDSDDDPIIKEELEKYPFYIDFISINKENKNWVNPVINYNIGFQYIKGNKVVIQNAEVCHVGDVLSYMGKKTIDNYYYVCDVRASKTSRTNDFIYDINTDTINIYKYNELFGIWYQGVKRLVNYHFLCCMTIQTFNKIKNFSYDYTMGIAYDDDDFVLKIIANNIKIKNLFFNEYNFGGIHLWHKSSLKKNAESNISIFTKKNIYYRNNKKYIDFIEEKNIEKNIEKDIQINIEKEIINIEINKKTNLLELQELLLKFINDTIINIRVNKATITPQINTFRKCLLKGYCYKNSAIKFPKNLTIKFIFV